MVKSQKREKYKTDISILPKVFWHTGEPMYPIIGNKEKIVYYQAKYSYNVVPLYQLEDIVLKGLIKDLDKVTVLKDIDSDGSLEERKNFYSSQIKKLEEQKKKLLKKFLDEKITENIFDQFIAKADFDIMNHKKEIAKIEKLQLNKIKIQDNIEFLKKHLNILKTTNDRHELKVILKVLIKEVRMVNNFRPVVITNIF